MSSETEENNENTCVVCFKSIDIYSIGNCDHMVCYECSTRMRVLCCQNECPICRQDLPKVIFTNSLKPFNKIDSTKYYEDKKHKVLFENKRIRQAFYKLLEHSCSICPNKMFKTFQHLYDHMKREHELYYCDLCVEHLKIFTFERRCYNRTDLVQHKRKGDEDDRSHRGHPLCQFCQTRFVDNDFLYRHLRKDHLFCHFCDADGRDFYYSSYEYLRDHFREEHYLCEEGACMDEKFTPVFRTLIDLKAHRMSVHGKTLGRGAAKQARLLELEFTVKPRSRQLESDYKFRTLDSRSPEGAAALCLDSPPKCHSPTLDPNDFPSLPSGSGTITASSVPQRQARTGALTIQAISRRCAPLAMNDENFPALGDHNENSQGTSVRLNINQDRSVNNGRSSTNAPSRNVSIHVNHKLNGEQSINIKQDDFPALPSDSKAPSRPSAKWVPVPNKKTTASSAPRQEKHSKPPASGGDFPELSTMFNTNLNLNLNLKSKEPLKPNYVNLRSSKGDEKNAKKASSVLIPVREDGLDVSEASTSNAKAKIKKKKSKSNNITDEKLETPKKKDDKEKNDNSRGITESVKIKASTSALNSGSYTKLVKPLPTVEDWFGDDRKLRPKSEGKDDGINVRYKSFTNSGPSGDEGARSFNLEEFRSNNVRGPQAFKQGIKAPPGFDNLHSMARSKPPPGFGVNFPRSNDLTFTNSRGQIYAIPANYGYIPPPNFEKRNKNLVKQVTHMLSTERNLEEFKRMSGLFRQDMLSADDYCNHCVQTMGEDGFQDVFPELLILLPDIKKQQEFYEVFLRSVKSELVQSKLHICEACHQVLCKSNIKEHADKHKMQQEFPSLLVSNWT